MMIDIVLLTACSRPDSLPIMLESIKRAFGVNEEERLNNGFDLTWVISRDKYNCRGSVDEFYKTLFEDGIKFFGFESGKEGQKNFGGDIYNDALSWLFEHFGAVGKDPWVYIFDDDNIINPLLPYFITKIEEKTPNKRGAWLWYEQANGYINDANQYFGFWETPTQGEKMYFFRNPDPSGVVLRLSVYKENFPMAGGGDYDFEYMRKITKNLFYNGELAFQNELEKERSRVAAFHNGIRFDEDVEWDMNEANNVLITCRVEDARWTDDNYGAHLFVIPKEANREILEVIKKYNYAIKPWSE